MFVRDHCLHADAVARFAKEVGAERTLCLTATVESLPWTGKLEEKTDCWQATPQVAVDICAAFGIDKDGVFRTTSYRSK